MSFTTIYGDPQLQFSSKVGKQKYSSSSEIEQSLILFSDMSQFYVSVGEHAISCTIFIKCSLFQLRM